MPSSPTVAPPPLSLAQFQAAVLEPFPETAVFDCDGTLWSGDAGSAFKVWTIKVGLVSREMTDWIDERYRLYLRGDVDERTICGEMVQMYQGLREQEMRDAAERFVAEYVRPRVFAEMQQTLQTLHEGGTEIWAVSSTNNWVIEAGVREFGIPPERVLAATVRSNNGLVTHELLDVPTDEGKAVALRRVGLGAPDAVFGNSIHDAAMLALARRPFAVNPTVALLERAAESAWPSFWPASVDPHRERTPPHLS